MLPSSFKVPMMGVGFFWQVFWGLREREGEAFGSSHKVINYSFSKILLKARRNF